MRVVMMPESVTASWANAADPIESAVETKTSAAHTRRTLVFRISARSLLPTAAVQVAKPVQ